MTGQTDVRIGLCGFSMAMADYPRHFPVVEVQQTFYEPPGDAVFQRWLSATPRSLEYTMKVWQLVTHAANSPTYRRLRRPLDPGAEPGSFRDSRAVAEGWRRSVQCARVLGATAMLFQCPASFGPSPESVSRMQRFFGNIERPSARLLWEPRGPRWVSERSLAISICRELDLVHVVDPFVTPPEPGHPIYWRLHGTDGPRSSYSDSELQRLRELVLKNGAEGPAYVLFNNLPRIGDAKRFVSMLAAP
jgi:uncharacterized protein YecE (DUF72 family)